jgi:Sigma-70, region 4
VALADPDLPPSIALPELSPGPPLGLNADRYRWLREAFYELPRRSRVVVVLRLPLPDRRPLTLDAIGVLFGVTLERVRQLEHHAIWMLVRAWRLQVSPSELNRDERMAEIAPILGAAIDRYPLEDAAWH